MVALTFDDDEEYGLAALIRICCKSVRDREPSKREVPDSLNVLAAVGVLCRGQRSRRLMPFLPCFQLRDLCWPGAKRAKHTSMCVCLPGCSAPAYWEH